MWDNELNEVGRAEPASVPGGYGGPDSGGAGVDCLEGGAGRPGRGRDGKPLRAAELTRERVGVLEEYLETL